MPKIVILGAGFGGLRAALDIAKNLRNDRSLEVFLVDKNSYHTYTPLLYALAAGAPIAESEAAWPLAAILRGTGVRHVEDAVKELDLSSGTVYLSRGAELLVDYLVLAPGSETNYFNIPGLEERSLALKTLDSAKSIRARLSALPPGAMVVVGGGGPAGIELAAEIKFRRSDLEVSIVEAMPTLLPGFDPSIVRRAEKRLQSLGIKVLRESPITEVKETTIILKSGEEVPWNALIWTGGVKAPALLTTLPLKLDPRGRVAASRGMECVPQTPDLEFSPMVYALGDAVCVYGPDGKPVPGMARTAIRQAQVVAENITKDILKRSASHKTYLHKTYPYVVPIGGRWGLAKIGPFRVTGVAGWLFKELIELAYLASIVPARNVFRFWRGKF